MCHPEPPLRALGCVQQVHQQRWRLELSFVVKCNVSREEIERVMKEVEFNQDNFINFDDFVEANVTPCPKDLFDSNDEFVAANTNDLNVTRPMRGLTSANWQPANSALSTK